MSVAMTEPYYRPVGLPDGSVERITDDATVDDWLARAEGGDWLHHELAEIIRRLLVPPPGTVTISVEDHIRLISSAVPQGYHIEWETCCHYDPTENHPRPVLYRDETCLIGSPPIPRGDP